MRHDGVGHARALEQLDPRSGIEELLGLEGADPLRHRRLGLNPDRRVNVVDWRDESRCDETGADRDDEDRHDQPAVSSDGATRALQRLAEAASSAAAPVPRARPPSVPPTVLERVGAGDVFGHGSLVGEMLFLINEVDRLGDGMLLRRKTVNSERSTERPAVTTANHENVPAAAARRSRRRRADEDGPATCRRPARRACPAGSQITSAPRRMTIPAMSALPLGPPGLHDHVAERRICQRIDVSRSSRPGQAPRSGRAACFEQSVPLCTAQNARSSLSLSSERRTPSSDRSAMRGNSRRRPARTMRVSGIPMKSFGMSALP